jgi:CRP-like cAMP-binding protein
LRIGLISLLEELYPDRYVAMATNIGSVKLMLEELYKGRPLWSYASGKRIPLFEDEVCVIYRGIIRTQTLHAGGEESILCLVGPMMPVARKFTLLNPYEAYALTHVDILRLKWEEVDRSDVLTRELNRSLIQRLRQTEVMLALLSKRQTSERLIGFLCFLAQEYGKQTPQGIRIDVQLTHQQIADAICTTRVTITRLLGILRKASLIRIGQDRHFSVMDDLANNHDLDFSRMV